MITHPCPGCGNAVMPGHFACSACWRSLPARHRHEISRTWMRRQHRFKGSVSEHQAAKKAAIEWLEQRRQTR